MKKYSLLIICMITVCMVLAGCDETESSSVSSIAAEVKASGEKVKENTSSINQTEGDDSVEQEESDGDMGSETDAPETEEITDSEETGENLETAETSMPTEKAESAESAEPAESPEPAADSYPVGTGSAIDFNTVDINGNAFSTQRLQNAKVVMLNLWEPWCGPCVNEMPELNELYNNYKDKGLLIIGAYTTFDMDDDAKEIVDKLGISYPIIKCNRSIYKIEQDYVPATYLLDHNGNLITEEPFAGADSYKGWESVVLEYLK